MRWRRMVDVISGGNLNGMLQRVTRNFETVFLERHNYKTIGRLASSVFCAFPTDGRRCYRTRCGSAGELLSRVIAVLATRVRNFAFVRVILVNSKTFVSRHDYVVVRRATKSLRNDLRFWKRPRNIILYVTRALDGAKSSLFE